MRAPGIIGTIQLAAILVFALPAILFGAEWLVRGRPLGAVFVALGLSMLALKFLLTDPLDPADIAEAAVDYVREEEK